MIKLSVYFVSLISFISDKFFYFSFFIVISLLEINSFSKTFGSIENCLLEKYEMEAKKKFLP